jgi:ABC-type nitrate/sulfonate/bicarbonate transport system ATPase subunit
VNRSLDEILLMLLDKKVNDAVDKILQSRQTTCLFVAHRLSTIARAERIVVLEGKYPPFFVLHYILRIMCALPQMVESPSLGHTDN